jgi:hypothetical protein
MYGLLAVEPTEWTASAIIALLITNIGTLYKLFKTEKRTDTAADRERDDNLVGQWRAWGKSMEAGRVKAELKKGEAEDRERKLIAEVSRLAECVRQREERIEELEREAGNTE